MSGYAHFGNGSKAEVIELRWHVRFTLDCVEKLENRGAPKISQMYRIGDFSRCKAL